VALKKSSFCHFVPKNGKAYHNFKEYPFFIYRSKICNLGHGDFQWKIQYLKRNLINKKLNFISKIQNLIFLLFILFYLIPSLI
jgi:hypothetical protein